jgi:dihydroneopterin aldolase
MSVDADQTRRVTVMKIGGSLGESGAAARLMRAIGNRRPPEVVVVPGGGDFADAVRAAQSAHGLTDGAAHHMALLAMHQYAVMLADFAAGFVLADTAQVFESAWREGLTPIWLPAPMVLAAEDIAPSWDVTSDSLAAWLCASIDAARLVLVKSVVIPAHAARDPAALSVAGIVDRAFPALVTGRRFAWEIVSDVEGALAALR